MKVVKRLVLTLIAVVVLPVMALILLIFTIDPNRLKPVLVNAAAEQGLSLKLGGDIGWQLYPKFGLSIGEIELRRQQTQQLMTSVKQVSAAVQLRPLLERKLVVQGFGLNGLELYYTVEADGSSPWDMFTSPDKGEAPATKTPQPEGDQSPPELSIAKVHISNSKLQYHDKAAGQKASLVIQRLNLDNIDLKGQGFPLDLQVSMAATGQPSIQVGLQTKLALNLEAQTLKLPLTSLNTSVGGQPVKAKLSSDLSWAEPLSAKGALRLQPFALPALLNALAIEPPATAAPQALSKVSLDFNYQLQGETLNLSNLRANIDDFELSGELKLQSFAKPAINVQLRGTTLQLDDYLPPPAEEGEATSAAEPAAPTPLPVEVLRELNLDAALQVRQIDYSGLLLTGNKLSLSANKGVIQLTELSSKVLNGQLDIMGQLDASKETPTLSASIDTSNLDVGKLLITFAEFDQLEGMISSDISLRSHGKTDQALLDNIQIEGALQSKDVHLTPFNLEQQFCKAVALLQQELPPAHDWAELTRFEPVKLDFSFAENTFSLDSLNASIAKLATTASGRFNLKSGEFDFPIYLSISDFAGDIAGCLPIKDRWREQKIPFRCKGNLDSIGVKTCLPDHRQIEDLLKAKLKATFKEKADAERERAERKAKEKLEAEKRRAEAKLEEEKRKALEKAEAEKRRAKEKARDAEEKAKAKAREALKEKLKDEQKVKEAEEKLRDIFKGLKD